MLDSAVMRRCPDMLDCLVIGGGPGGMVAATYLKRFHRNVAVVDDGCSRADLIAKSHNIPGFPRGISGTRMLRRIQDHARRMHVTTHRDRVVSLLRSGDVFHAYGREGVWHARTVVLATGVVDRMPPILDIRRALRRGIVRLCPVCDAYEASGRRIAIYGGNYEDLKTHARFLRTFSPHAITVIATDEDAAAHPRRTVSQGINILRAPDKVIFGPRSCRIADRHRTVEVDVVYIALGADVQSSLAEILGADTDEDGALVVDAQMQTCIEGLYAVGDVVKGLNQISAATGQAAIAATAIHNRLPLNAMDAV